MYMSITVSRPPAICTSSTSILRNGSFNIAAAEAEAAEPCPRACFNMLTRRSLPVQYALSDSQVALLLQTAEAHWGCSNKQSQVTIWLN
jgi:hypothetical protein